MNRKIIFGLFVLLVITSACSNEVQPSSNDESFVGGGCGVSAKDIDDRGLFYDWEDIIKHDGEWGDVV